MQLVDNWKKLYKAYSVWALAAATLIAGVLSQWESLPQSLKDQIPPQWLAGVGTVVGIVGLIGRFLQQSATLPIPDDTEPAPLK